MYHPNVRDQAQCEHEWTNSLEFQELSNFRMHLILQVPLQSKSVVVSQRRNEWFSVQGLRLTVKP